MLSLGAFEGGWGAEFSKMSASLVARLVTGQHGSLHEGSRSGGPCTASKRNKMADHGTRRLRTAKATLATRTLWQPASFKSTIPLM